MLTVISAVAAGELFEQLVEESRLRLTVPDDFAPVAVQANDVLSYEYALRSGDGSVEARYVVRPLGRIKIDYDDPHNAAPEPNHLFPLLYESLLGGLSRRGSYHKNDYPPSEAKQLFNADWAAAAVLDIKPGFATGLSQALVIAIHKDEWADAYTVILFDDYETSREVIRSAVGSLKFEALMASPKQGQQ